VDEVFGTHTIMVPTRRIAHLHAERHATQLRLATHIGRHGITGLRLGLAPPRLAWRTATSTTGTWGAGTPA
jgi:hypothetical protein